MVTATATAKTEPREVLVSQLAISWLRLEGEDFSFDLYPMHKAFYNGRFPRTLFKTSRQIGKSVTLANLSILECCTIPHFSTMFVSPSKEQTTRFSNTRLSKIMRYSPHIRQNFLQSDLSDRILHKQYTNGAEMLLTYASDDAERLRGPSTDRNMYDEVQDMLFDPVIVVGNETMANSDHRFETYAGTPKTTENTIQYLWDISTQNEWVMQCDGCGQRQFIDSDKSLGLHGPICLKCGAPLNPFKGQWVMFKPPDKTRNETWHTKLHGFHVSQLIMPKNVPVAMQPWGQKAVDQAQLRWDSILTKHREYSPSKFNNEVIGISDAIGTRLITIEELEACCNPERTIKDGAPDPLALKDMSLCVAGVDWSGGGTTGVSRSVIWVWGFHVPTQKLVCVYYKIYPGQNPVTIVDEIAVVNTIYRTQIVVGDAGEGHMANSLLANKIGAHRVHQLQYGAQKQALKWNGVDRFTGDRTMLIDNYIMMLKKGGVEFANQRQMEPAFEDILNEYEEVTQLGKKVWRHSPHKPDDCLHAGLFGWIAFKITQGDMKFYQ